MLIKIRFLRLVLRASTRVAAISLLFGFAALFTRLEAQDRMFPPRLDLETAVDKTLDSNPETKRAETETKVAELSIEGARLGKKPSFEFSQQFTRSNNPTFVFASLLEQGRFGASNFAVDTLNHPDGVNNFRTMFSARMPLYDGHKTRTRVSQAELQKEQSDLKVEAMRQELRFNVVRTYFAAVLGREMVKVSEDAMKAAESNRKKTRDMVDVGMTTEADYLAADVELAHTGQQKIEAESGLITTLETLNVMMGDEPGFEKEITGTLTERYFPIEERDDLIRIAFENRLDLKMADLGIRNSKISTQSVVDEKLPSVNAFANFGYSSPYIANGSSDYTVGVNLTYTLFDAGRKNRLAKSTEGETIAELEKRSLENKIRIEVISALQANKTAKAKIEVSIKSIAHAEEALRIIQDRYKFGLTTITEVLRAEAALVRSKHSLLAARYEYLVSHAQVLLVTGRLNDVKAFE
ncbi:MAG: TolC family protein [Pyrinomonadaceae bacterium]